MSVLVDTPIWAFALHRWVSHRSADEELHARELAGLIRDKRALLLGPCARRCCRESATG